MVLVGEETRDCPAIKNLRWRCQEGTCPEGSGQQLDQNGYHSAKAQQANCLANMATQPSHCDCGLLHRRVFPVAMQLKAWVSVVSFPKHFAFTIVWTGIQVDLALGGKFFHGHPLSTHIWYQNVQVTFQRQFRQTFTEQGSKWKHKATKSIHSSSRKKRIPHGISRNAD